MEDSGSWLVSGQGNPGPEYENSLHNLGFRVVERIADRNGIRVSRPESRAVIGVGRIAAAQVVLAKPQTFYNLSGTSIKPLMEKYGVDRSRLIVVYDELDLPWTGVRIRSKGSAAGNHGMENVIKTLGTQEFTRVRLGIHPGHPIKDGAEFVLSPIRKVLLQELDELLDHASGAVESIIADGVEMAMTKFNRRARGSNEEDK